MNCGKCDTKMFQAKMFGWMPSVPIQLANIKNGLLDEEKKSTVSCHVCPSCGYIELYADDPQMVWTP